MSDRPERSDRSAFRLFRPIATRWMDNDAYGHVNNVHYYSYFDSAVNGWLVESGLLAIAESPVIGLVVESGCSYFESVAFPDALEAGIAVAHLGRSSVRYRIGIFKAGSGAGGGAGAFRPCLCGSHHPASGGDSVRDPEGAQRIDLSRPLNETSATPTITTAPPVSSRRPMLSLRNSTAMMVVQTGVR